MVIGPLVLLVDLVVYVDSLGGVIGAGFDGVGTWCLHWKLKPIIDANGVENFT